MLAQKLLAAGNPKLVTSLGGSSYGGTAGTSLTATAFNLGAPSPDRVIVVTVAAGGAAARQVSGITIGGVSMNLAVRSASVSQCTGIYYLAVPSGTSADIVYSFTGSVSPLTSCVYSLTGWGSVTLYDSNTANGTGFDLTTASDLNTAAGGLLLAVAATVAGSSPNFSSSPTLTQDQAYNNGFSHGLCASKWPSAAATNTAVTLHTDTSSASKSLCAATFS